MTPSNMPARKPKPWPMSARSVSPSTSLCTAMSSIDGEMSRPTHECPASVSTSPLSPLPHPMSRISFGESSGKLRSSKQRSAIAVWIAMIRELPVYLDASLSS